MIWIEPKTDWTAEDTFNAVDYNRIKNNIEYVAEYLGGKHDIHIEDMGQDLDYESAPTASQLSLFPQNLTRINDGSYQLITIKNVTYEDNGIAPNYEEWNRIEGALVFFKTLYESEIEYVPHIAFRLGNRKAFGRRIGG